MLAATLLLGGSLVWAGVYTYDKGFTKKWRNMITAEFERRGIEAEIGKLTLDPFEGLVARDVQFYQDDSRDRLLASINHIALDIDLAKLVRQEDFLNTIDIKNADLSLPLNPDDSKSERIELSNLSAHVTMATSTIEISSVTGQLYGVDFKLNGTLLKPPQKTTPAQSAPDPATTTDPPPKNNRNPLADSLAVLHKSQPAIQRSIDFLESLDLNQSPPPEIDISFSGDLADPSTLQARAEITARKISYKTFAIDSLASVIEFHDGTTELKRFTVTDQKGRLNVFARYAPGTPTLPFNIESTIDAHALASALIDWPTLGEVVFYDAPAINIEGTIDLSGKPHPAPLWGIELPQINAVGNVGCGTVLSRGSIFDSVAFDFSYRPDALYIRNAAIGHKSGDTTFQVLHQTGHDLRWKARVATQPSAFIPFVKEKTRKLLARIGTGPDTDFHIDVECTGPASDKRQWDIRSTIDAEDFTFNDVPVSKLLTGLDICDRVYTFTAGHVTRPDGIIVAEKVVLDLNNHTVTIESGSSSSSPVDSAPLFSSKLVDILASYPFSQPPVANISGVIDIRKTAPLGPHPPKKTDLEVEFVTSGGTFGYTLSEQQLVFDNARGRIRLLGRDVGMNLAGRAVPGTTFKSATLDSGADVAFQGWVQKKAVDKTEIDLTLTIGSAGSAHYHLLGDDLPLQSPSGTLKFTSGKVDIDIGSSIPPGSSFHDISFTTGATFTAQGWKQTTGTGADLNIEVASGGTASYGFLGKPLTLTDTGASIHLADTEMKMEITSGLFGGRSTSNVVFSNFGSPSTPYTGQLGVTSLNLSSIANLYSPNQKTKGTFSADFSFSGNLQTPYSLTGLGSASIRDGNIYAFPILGPLSPVVSLTLTDKNAGYSVAREGNAQFSTAGGVITLGSFEALTSTFRLTTAGTIDYRNDALDLSARLNARGAAGILLFPVSKLLEYRATGKIKEPVWEPAITAGTGTKPSNIPRQPSGKKPPNR